MSTVITMRMPNGKPSTIAVDTLPNGNVDLVFSHSSEGELLVRLPAHAVGELAAALAARSAAPAVGAEPVHLSNDPPFALAWLLNVVLCEVMEAGTSESREIAARVAADPRIMKAITPPDHGGREAMAAKRGIYIASKTKHADRWKALRTAGLPIISTWIDEAGAGQTDDFDDLWSRCLSEATNCAVLIAYSEPGEVLKGAWVEIGAALSTGVPVFAVGLDGYTIGKYRGITHFASMDDAVRAALSPPQSASEPPA